VQFIKQNINFDFIGKARKAGILSVVLILISAGSMIIKGGPKYGIDFAGGTLIQVQFTKQMNVANIRDIIDNVDLASASVQPFGDESENEYLISINKTVDDLQGLSGKIKNIFDESFGKENFEIRRVEMVGPKVGADLRQKGFMAVICSLLGMLAYIWWRFEFKFGIGAILALTHDVIITLGALSLTNKAIDLPIIAAILTVVGYSVNDTIIVCDRIRENTRRMGREKLAKVINVSINHTLSRTIITSLTTLLVVVALFFFGGGVIHDFAFTLMIGVFVGTYSSIFIASPLLLLWEKLLHDSRAQSK
jgi:preprotein translocase subunit SecF